MCGIVGYLGHKLAAPNLITALKKLEYRGYDSAGIALLDSRGLQVFKAAGSVANLVKSLPAKPAGSQLGIGHTRWATHGRPSKTNAHPHVSQSGRVALVHNGIIENYQRLKTHLGKLGYKFKSETDSEALANLIDYCLTRQSDFELALAQALRFVRGTYGLAVLDRQQPDFIWAAANSCPLIIGLGQDENWLTSDASALLDQTRQVIHLRDGEIAKLSRDQVKLTDLKQAPVEPTLSQLEGDLTQVQKGNYPDFMLKEIHEAPLVIAASSQGRLKPDKQLIKLGGLELVEPQLRDVRQLIIVACGTSYYAGLVGEYWLEALTKLRVDVQLASEFRYRRQSFSQQTAVLAISQSGETADTLEAIKLAQAKGLLTLGIVNVVGSAIARLTSAGVYNHAGPEIGVASTKAFLSQLTVLLMMTGLLTNDLKAKAELIASLASLGPDLETCLKLAPELEKLAGRFKTTSSCLFIGRGLSYPVALEGALKLKEVSYIHAEGYAAGELKHGPLALVDKQTPTIAILPKDRLYPKTLANLAEIKARGGQIIAITDQPDAELKQLTKDIIMIPKTNRFSQPFLTVIPLQLLAYYVGCARGLNVDQPRNLAKSVTVE